MIFKNPISLCWSCLILAYRFCASRLLDLKSEIWSLLLPQNLCQGTPMVPTSTIKVYCRAEGTAELLRSYLRPNINPLLVIFSPFYSLPRKMEIPGIIRQIILMWGAWRVIMLLSLGLSAALQPHSSLATRAWGKQIQNLTTRVRANFCGILHKCHLESVNLAMKQLETFNLGSHFLTRNLNSICIIITDDCSEISWWWYNFIYKGNFELNFHIVNFESNQNTIHQSQSHQKLHSTSAVLSL